MPECLGCRNSAAKGCTKSRCGRCCDGRGCRRHASYGAQQAAKQSEDTKNLAMEILTAHFDEERRKQDEKNRSFISKIFGSKYS
tara:strand:- start:1723 stop:1974 length:252 start_codon:yes stop_codon:yes gene_type:complete